MINLVGAKRKPLSRLQPRAALEEVSIAAYNELERNIEIKHKQLSKNSKLDQRIVTAIKDSAYQTREVIRYEPFFEYYVDEMFRSLTRFGIDGEERMKPQEVCVALIAEIEWMERLYEIDMEALAKSGLNLSPEEREANKDQIALCVNAATTVLDVVSQYENETQVEDGDVTEEYYDFLSHIQFRVDETNQKIDKHVPHNFEVYHAYVHETEFWNVFHAPLKEHVINKKDTGLIRQIEQFCIKQALNMNVVCNAKKNGTKVAYLHSVDILPMGIVHK